MENEVFVSYRRGDGPSLELIAAVESVYDPTRVFVDRSDIQPSVAFPAAMADAVRSCSVVVALIGANWVKPLNGQMDWVVEELNYAQQYGKPVLPVLLHGPMPPPATLPPQIQYVAYRNALPRRATNLGELVREIVDELKHFRVQPRPRTTLHGTSRHATVASWISRLQPAEELARVIGRCQAEGAKVTSRSSHAAELRFGSKLKSRINGLLTRVEDMPVDFQVQVAPGPGVTLVEARCDEAFGMGILQQAKYDTAFERIWSLVTPTSP